MRLPLRYLALLSLCLLASCARVQPWEKEALAEPRMRFSQDSDAQHFVDHAIITQEQAEGGSGGVGGGCGCR